MGILTNLKRRRRSSKFLSLLILLILQEVFKPIKVTQPKKKGFIK